MLGAAQALHIPELEALAFGFGMRHVGASCPVSTALMCLERFRVAGSREFASSWQRALLRAYSTAEILRSPEFNELSLVTLQALLRACTMHEDENQLWVACLGWARAQAAREPAGEPEARPPLAPRKIFGRSAQPVVPKQVCGPFAKPIVEKQAHDSSSRPADIQWQRWLLPLAPVFRFALMGDKDFAANVQEIHDMLPELRSAIYTSRRRDVRTFTIKDDP